MGSSIVRLVVVMGTLGIPGLAGAQSAETEVTFTLSVQLAQLSPDVDRVGLVCVIVPSSALRYPDDLQRLLVSTRSVSESWPFRDELPVVAGQANGILRVAYRVWAEWFVAPIGKAADYTCSLVGHSKSLQRWDVFSEAPAEPVFLLTPTPKIRGVFTW